MRTLSSDLRFALRLMARDRAFAIGAVLTLALCIGANTAIFAVVRSVLYRPLPYADPGRLVMPYDSFPGAGVEHAGTSVPNYMDRRSMTDVFESQALFRSRGVDVGLAGVAERVKAMQVTPSFFHVLGRWPVRGRAFSEAEGTPGQDRKLILDYGYAQKTFGRAEAAVGRQLSVNGEGFEVVGVMPRGFAFMDAEVRIWMPRAFQPSELVDEERYSQNHDAIARLAKGATIERATHRVDALNAANLERAGPLKEMLAGTGYHTVIAPYGDYLVRGIRRPLQLLLGGVLFVLLIAAVNITNLVLVRTSGRRKELATRHALGAGRGRVARQLLTETTLLTVLGAMLGFGVGVAGLRGLAAIGLSDLPRGNEIGMDWTVAAFTAGLAVVLGIATALVPVVQLAAMNVTAALHEEGRSGTAGRGARLFRRGLVVAQVALAFVLLLGAGLLLSSFRQMLAIDPGYQPTHVLTGMVNPPRTRYPDDASLRTFAGRALERVRQLPGVEAAGISSALPLGGDYSSSVILPEGYIPKPGESVISPNRNDASAGYFEAMGIGLVRGRLFARQDTADAPGAIIVDDRLAHKFWPNVDPIGRRVLQPRSPEDLIKPGPNSRWLTVVGVVKTVKLTALVDEGDERPGAYYLPFDQEPDSGIGFAVRTHGDPVAATSAIRRVLADIDPALSFYDVRSMTDRVEHSLNPRRTPMLLSLGFALTALLLAAIGIYAVLAYQVQLRSREIGIRMALGSAPGSILRLILLEGGALVVAGLAGGALGIFALKPVISSQLVGVSALDPLVIGTVVGLLGGVAAIACLGPARRAAHVNPVVALGSQ
jgi:predicted permease